MQNWWSARKVSSRSLRNIRRCVAACPTGAASRPSSEVSLVRGSNLGNLEGGLAAADASLKTLVEVQDHYSIDVIRGHGGRGRTLDALGRSEEAIEEYQKALEALKLQANRTFICDGPGCLDSFRGGIS